MKTDTNNQALREIDLLLGQPGAGTNDPQITVSAVKDLIAGAGSDYRAMFNAAVSSLAQISDALGIDPEEAACANGNSLILEAIARKNDALLSALKR
ncbi:hypothetical protein RD110_18795 [Rhodoferax koreense]|uniref:Uncharacterized protein n=1 Tax=Rhodoferax koreensis TaxID=1842727 RepID=A0A1P8JZ24_9BURK|nr:hypothetical protein [Rhodoferax koreense]APW39003.1 hypothetical protein RD110_18795 [Rhodoferax koreense]